MRGRGMVWGLSVAGLCQQPWAGGRWQIRADRSLWGLYLSFFPYPPTIFQAWGPGPSGRETGRCLLNCGTPNPALPSAATWRCHEGCSRLSPGACPYPPAWSLRPPPHLLGLLSLLLPPAGTYFPPEQGCSFRSSSGDRLLGTFGASRPALPVTPESSVYPLVVALAARVTHPLD